MSRPRTNLEGRRALGIALRERRSNMGWTLRDLSDRCGISVGHLSDIERGEGNVTLEALAVIASAYDMLAIDVLRGVYPYGERTQ